MSRLSASPRSALGGSGKYFGGLASGPIRGRLVARATTGQCPRVLNDAGTDLLSTCLAWTNKKENQLPNSSLPMISTLCLIVMEHLHERDVDLILRGSCNGCFVTNVMDCHLQCLRCNAGLAHLYSLLTSEKHLNSLSSRFESLAGVHTMLDRRLRPENIPLAISRLRQDSQVPTVDKHFDGGQCRVFKVDFPDGESWAVRVPLFIGNVSPEVIIAVMQSEADLLQELKTKGFSWAARLRGSSLSFHNDIGYPFLAMTWIPGKTLEWSKEHEHPARPLRDKILGQVALIQASLIECTKETSVSAHVTATEHFQKIIERKFQRVRDGLLPILTEQDCLEQQRILPGVLFPELDDAPFAIDHGDLAPQNIVVDSAYNITG